MAADDALNDPASNAAASTAPAPPRPLLGWRTMALLYDLVPALGLWFAVGAIAVLLNGGEPVYGDTVAGWLELLALWLVTGAYATVSWRRGGQTLGMRAWRLRLVAADGGVLGWRALLVRYAVGTLSLLAVGAGFWWGWIDRDRLTWHDRASATRVVREPKPA
ncbi:MAG TPA: RDD family protein [Lysobacter sp.]|nr:RDD family protein [Lysobacter sp.]